MSEENVEVVRRGFAAASRGDLEEVLEMWASDAIWDGEQISLTLYQTKRDALEAAGLRE